MKESKPSIDAIGKGPQICVWIIFKIPELRLTPFFICLTKPLMQLMHCSNSENYNGGRIDLCTKISILPLKIWPKRQCHNFEDELSICIRFFLSFVDVESCSISHTFPTH
jgi:hypothetical protein